MPLSSERNTTFGSLFRRSAVSTTAVVRHDQHVGVDEQLLGFERPPFGDRQHHEREVDVPALDQRLEFVVADRLAELDVDLRPCLLEAPDDSGQDAGADALVAGDAKLSGRALRERREVGLGRVHPRDDRLRMAEQELAGFGQRDSLRPSRAFDEAFADRALERLDLLAHGRLGVAELDRRPAEGALAGDGLESEQMAKLDAKETISFHNGSHHNIDLC